MRKHPPHSTSELTSRVAFALDAGWLANTINRCRPFSFFKFSPPSCCVIFLKTRMFSSTLETREKKMKEIRSLGGRARRWFKMKNGHRVRDDVFVIANFIRFFPNLLVVFTARLMIFQDQQHVGLSQQRTSRYRTLSISKSAPFVCVCL